MKIGRGWLAVMGVGAAVMGSVTAQQMEQSRTVTVTLTSNKIEVNTGRTCTKLNSAFLKGGTKIQWVKGTGVNNFHAIFPISPVKSGRTYFDGTISYTDDDLTLLTITDPNEEA
jgi:hypothetical protein